MQWQGRRQSNRVHDARSNAGGGTLRGGAGLLFILFRMFGIKGVIAMLIIGGVLWGLGVVDPQLFLGGAPVARQVSGSSAETEQLAFVKVVLADTERIWQREFQRIKRPYSLPSLTVFRQRIVTACGPGNATMGPFYCSADRTIYLDLSFYEELERSFNAPGDFAQAYVIAHEVGHHVQNLLGTMAQVHQQRGSAAANEQSVRLELQADFYAGVWAHHSREYLDEGDIEEAMQAANAIGDDAIQQKTRGKVVPHAFTHGTSAQRMRWFRRGFQSGKIEDGDTFAVPYEDL